MKEGTTQTVWVGVGLLLLLPLEALATWSIVAVDPSSGQVGIAAASCAGGIERIGGLVPGKGAVVAQAVANTAARDRAAKLIAAGVSPQEAISEIANEEFDPTPFYSWSSGAKTRQYAVVMLGFEQHPASFTGSRTIGWSGVTFGYAVSAQGNMLRGHHVIDAALAAFQESATGGLADRLIAALEAGASAGGDRRCAENSPALSAYLTVARPMDMADAPYLRLVVSHGRTDAEAAWRFPIQLVWPERVRPDENPVHILRSRYDAWREQRRER